jgi:hypothetical protein
MPNAAMGVMAEPIFVVFKISGSTPCPGQSLRAGIEPHSRSMDGDLDASI